MSFSKDDSTVDKKMSRRSVVRWAGALAAAEIIGVGLGFGGDLLIRQTTTSASTTTSTATQTNLTATETQTNTPPSHSIAMDVN